MNGLFLLHSTETPPARVSVHVPAPARVHSMRALCSCLGSGAVVPQAPGRPSARNPLFSLFLFPYADKVVIHLDPSDSELTEFWRRRNPEALAVAEHTGFEAGEPATAFVCQVGGWVGT